MERIFWCIACACVCMCVCEILYEFLVWFNLCWISFRNRYRYPSFTLHNLEIEKKNALTWSMHIWILRNYKEEEETIQYTASVCGKHICGTHKKERYFTNIHQKKSKKEGGQAVGRSIGWYSKQNRTNELTNHSTNQPQTYEFCMCGCKWLCIRIYIAKHHFSHTFYYVQIVVHFWFLLHGFHEHI